jgi:predicted RNA-binding protein with TRAM domain
MYRGNRERSFGGGGGSFAPRTTAPVKVGEELDVTIEAVGEKGDGIAKKNGFVLFVPNVKEGQQVRIKVTRVLRKVGFAEVVGAAGAAPKADGAQEPAAEAPAEEAPAEEAPAEEASGDTEDFGEEAPAEEAPAEEEAAEDTGDETTE